MPMWFRSLVALAASGFILFSLMTRAADPLPARVNGEWRGAVQFERDVLPILKAHCFECHGQAKREGGLRFLQAGDLTHLNDSGEPAIIPGQPRKSELLRRVAATDDTRMPPDGDRLSSVDMETLTRWIQAGAKWPEDLNLATTHWAYVAPVRPELPRVSRRDWTRNAIDYFVLAQLDKRKLQPAPRAERARLIRRVYLDLIGVPPSPEEVDAFLDDDSPGAWENVVDRVLSSPAFGERWARPWLDLAHYADSNGFQADQFRSMWAFRDWVIRALNEDMPFDEFTLHQIAGDLLPDSTVDQKIATGFHRCPTCNVEAGVDPEENRVNQVVDRVNTTGTVWLGTTFECAQCHNHKYDPFTQKDYYQLFAFFNSTPLEVKLTSGVTFDFYGPKMDLPLSVESQQRINELDAQLSETQKQITSRSALLDEDASEWEAALRSKLAAKPQWHVLKVDRFNSAGGATHTTLDDDSVLIGGPNPDKDTYTVSLRTDVTGITGFRIEGLLDPSLPGNGPGRQTQENRANFVLTDLKITACPCEDETDSAKPVELHSPKGDVETARFEATNVLDDDPSSGWSIHSSYHKPHHLTVLTAELIGFEAGTRLTFTLDFQYGLQRSIGRLRLSALTGTPQQETVLEAIVKLLDKPQRKRSKSERKQLHEYRKKQDIALQKLQKELAAIQKKRNALKPATTLVMVEEGKPRTTNILMRGEFLNKGADVSPDVPGVLHSLPDGVPRNRIGLARWLVEAENPLVARVTVNRWWAEVFGRGIVATLEDFGTQGERPTHPELLDWLAVEFVESGWSMKHVLKQMVTSAAYQQSSRVSAEVRERDPRNLWLGRASRFRLPAETIRDNALMASGLIATKMHGEPVYPPQPPNIWRHVGRNAPKYATSTGLDRYRRGLYTVWRRSAPYPSFVNFDAPDRGACVVDRSRTNTPLQALNLMNDPAYVEMAFGLAERVLTESPSTNLSDRVELMFRLCLIRKPTDIERQFLIDVFESERQSFLQDASQLKELTSQWKTAQPIDRLELGTWYRIAEVLLNLDEMITRG